MDGTRAQAGVEFLLILAVSLVVITAIVLLAEQQVTTVQQQKDIADTQNSLLDIGSAAKEVYSEGEGSMKQVYIQLPSDYQPNASFVGNRSVVISAGGSSYADVEDFDVHGSLPGKSGGQWIWVISEGSRVRIGVAMMELDKNSIYIQMNANSTVTTSFTVTNIWGSAINVSTATTWSAPDVAMSGVPASFSLGNGAANTMTLQFTAGPDAGGFYMGEVELNASDGLGSMDSVTVPITVQVLPITRIIIQNNSQPTSPVITSVWQLPLPGYMYWPLMIYANASDTVNSTVKNCSIDADNAGNWTAMAASDGAYNQPNETVQHNYTAGFSLGPHSVRLLCMDAANLTGPMAFYYFNVTQPDAWGPEVIDMRSSPPYATTLMNVSVNATGTDLYTGDSNLQSCHLRVDSGAWVNLSVVSNSPTSNLSYNIGTMTAGTHTIGWQCTDVWGNVGGIYNETLVVVDVDVMLAIDNSGSMAYNITNVTDDSVVSAATSSWTLVKTLTMDVTNGKLANITTEIEVNVSNCRASYNVTVNGITVATGNQTSTTYVNMTNNNVNISAYALPFQVSLWLKRNATGCTAYNHLFSVQQMPSKMNVSQTSAVLFMGVVANTTKAGLVSFTTTATTLMTLVTMNASGRQAIDNAINGITPTAMTCIECGLDNSVNELISSRARANATKAIILLTDGVSNVGDSINGAVFARDNNVTVYTIGLGNDVNSTELTNIALLTYGKYYFAPDAAALQAIFQSIGR